jgi:hypothetical protein
MRDLSQYDRWRVDAGHGWLGDGTCGAFQIPYPATGSTLRVIASSDGDWDHCSVSLANRPPNWAEMQFIHRMFFNGDELAWEYHMPPDDHVNVHPYTLHLWRKHNFTMPVPPREFV